MKGREVKGKRGEEGKERGKRGEGVRREGKVRDGRGR